MPHTTTFMRSAVDRNRSRARANDARASHAQRRATRPHMGESFSPRRTQCAHASSAGMRVARSSRSERSDPHAADEHGHAYCTATFSVARRRHDRWRRRARFRCLPRVLCGCPAHKEHHGEASPCQLLGWNQCSRDGSAHFFVAKVAAGTKEGRWAGAPEC